MSMLHEPSSPWKPLSPIRDLTKGILGFYVKKNEPYYINPEFTLFMLGSYLGFAIMVGSVNYISRYNNHIPGSLSFDNKTEIATKTIIGNALAWGAGNLLIWGAKPLINSWRRRRTLAVKEARVPGIH